MKKTDAIIVMAGRGNRTGLEYNKSLYEINQLPLFMYSLQTFQKIENIENVYLVVSATDYDTVQSLVDGNNLAVQLVIGGSTRHQSVVNALKLVTSDYVLIHDAARPLINKEDIMNVLLATNEAGSLYHAVTDTIKMYQGDCLTTLDRNQLKAMSTPQCFNKKAMQMIIDGYDDATDEISCVEHNCQVTLVEEKHPNMKVTTKADLKYVSALLSNYSLIGHSLDFHPFASNRRLILGGVDIPFEQGLQGHSDADVVYHVVAEAIIGALGLGDLGTLFPDTDSKYLNIPSDYFIKEVMKEVSSRQVVIKNIDVIIYIEKPNLKPYKTMMAQNIKKLTNCEFVNVKATTMEKKGVIGNGEGVAAEAVCLIF